MFPQGNGFALVFDYMLSDLSEVIRNSDKPLTEVPICTITVMSKTFSSIKFHTF